MVLLSIYPKPVKQKLAKIIMYARIKTSPERYISLMAFASAFFSLFVTFYFRRFSLPILVLIFIGSFVVFSIFFYEYVLMKADSRANKIEQMLPDVLDLTASNLKAGLTPERALLISARPEFGPLKDELDKVGKDVAFGKDLKKALMGISERVMSENVERVMVLIASGVKSGGNLADLLKQASMSLRKNEMIEKKVRSVVSVYIMFIFSAIILGSPFLFATSTFLVEILGNIVATMEIPGGPGLPMSITLAPISITVVFPLIMVVLILTSVMASFIIGEIVKGKARYGFRYMPILAASSIGMLYLFRMIIGKFMGGISI